MKTLGKFEILEKIGQGAMGIVYKARDPLIGRLVALKTITTGVTEDPALLERFYQEARSAGALQHPNIVTIFELGKEDDTPFIAMEYLEGVSLDKLIEARPMMPLSQQLGYIVHVCRALEYAHKRGVVHRDVKPGNVMLTKEGTVKVVDFGIARLIESSHSQTGMLIGTLAYMSPQQIKGNRADARSDIWAAGAMFYELLTHHRPFDGDNCGALMMSILTQEAPPLSETAPGTPLDVSAVVERMLRKEAEERFQTMEEVLIELEPCWKRLQQVEVSGLLADAQHLFKARHLESALEAVRRVLQIDSENTEARNLLERINTEVRRTRTPAPEVGIETDHEHPEKTGQIPGTIGREESRAAADPGADSQVTLGPDANIGQFLRQTEKKTTPPAGVRASSRTGAAAAPALSPKASAPARQDFATPGVPIPGAPDGRMNSAPPVASSPAQKIAAASVARESAESASAAAGESAATSVVRSLRAARATLPWRKRPVPIAVSVLAVMMVAGAASYYLRQRPPAVLTPGTPIEATAPGATLAAAPPDVEGTRPVSGGAVSTDLERQQRLLITGAVDAANRDKDYRVALALLERAHALNGPLQREIARYQSEYGRLARLASTPAGNTSAQVPPIAPPQAPPLAVQAGGAPAAILPPVNRGDVASSQPAAPAIAGSPSQPPANNQPPVLPVASPASQPAVTAASSPANARTEAPVEPARAAPEPAPVQPAAASVNLDSPDRQAIAASIEQLSAAFSHRSMAELLEIWPRIGAIRNTLRTVFDTAQSLTREFHVQSLSISNDGVTATAIGTYDGRIRDGRGVETPSSGNFYVRLGKRNGKWLIDDASF